MRFPDYPGHFPGDPIVPGAALIQAVAAASDRPLVGLERVRFLGIVRPGEEVDLELRVDGDLLRFSVRRDGAEVARGIARLG